MGCWNETCGITNLPILEGNDVLLLLITNEKKISKEESYVHETGEMFGFPIKGLYNDYGSVKKIEIPDYLWDFYKSQKYIYEDDKEFSPENIEDLLEKACGYELSVLNKRNQYVSISPMFIHKEIYDIITSNIKNRIAYGTSNTHEYWTTLLLEKNIDDLIKHEKECLADEEDLFKEKGKKIKMRRLYCLHDKIWSWTGNSCPPSIFNYLQESLMQEKNKEYISDIVENIIFIQSLILLRKGFFSYTGLGSQCNEYKLHLIIEEWVIKKIEERVKDGYEIKEMIFKPYKLEET